MSVGPAPQGAETATDDALPLLAWGPGILTRIAASIAANARNLT